MSIPCPFCGVSLPSEPDAFCPECRQPLDDDVLRLARTAEGPRQRDFSHPDAHPPWQLTQNAAWVFIFSLIGGAVGGTATGGLFLESLAPGRYPLWFLIAPGILIAGGLCGLGLLVLRCLGIPLSQPRDPTPPQ